MLDTLSIWASIPGIACSEVQRGSWSWSSYTVVGGTHGFWEEEEEEVMVMVVMEMEEEEEVEGEEEEETVLVLVVVVVD